MTAPVSAGIFMTAGGGTIFPLLHRADATRPSHAVAAFQVDDLPGVVASLRGRGVMFEENDTPGLRTTDEIADMGGLSSGVAQGPRRELHRPTRAPANLTRGLCTHTECLLCWRAASKIRRRRHRSPCSSERTQDGRHRASAVARSQRSRWRRRPAHAPGSHQTRASLLAGSLLTEGSKHKSEPNRVALPEPRRTSHEILHRETRRRCPLVQPDPEAEAASTDPVRRRCRSEFPGGRDG